MDQDQLELSFDAFLRSFKMNIESPWSFLLGAGASITSDVQSAEDCIWDWKKDIYLSSNQNQSAFIDIHSETCRELIQHWLDAQHIYPLLGSDNEYAFYAKNAYPIADDRKLYFQSHCTGKTPYVGYYLLCLLHKFGVLKSVWTTNFDKLVETAAKKMDLDITNINLSNPSLINKTPTNSELLFIELHGDYKYSELKNTENELDAQNEDFANRLCSYFIANHLIVIGYSGRDKSLMSALKHAYSTAGTGRLYWCGYGQNVTEDVADLIQIARNNHREAYYINTDGFDKTLISLLKTVYKGDINKENEINKVLDAFPEPIENRPFSLDKLTISQCIRTNLHPIKMPSDVYKIDISYPKNVSPWKFIKERITGVDIVAVPHGKDELYAFGNPADINRLFEKEEKSAPCMIPLAVDTIRSHTELLSLYRKAVVCGLASLNGLIASISKNLIFNPKQTYSNIKNVYEAVKVYLHIAEDKKYAFISILPTLYFSDNEVSTEYRKQLLRAYFDKKRNVEYDDLLNYWEKKLFPQVRTIFSYPNNGNNRFVFQTSQKSVLAGIDYTHKGVIEESINNERLIFRGILIDEPKLEFTNRYSHNSVVDSNPMRGLCKNGPYDSQLLNHFANDISLGVICPTVYTQVFYAFLDNLNKRVAKDSQGDYLQVYEGFHSIYGCHLGIPSPDDKLFWVKCRNNQDDSIMLARNICEYAKRIASNRVGTTILIFIPKSWEKHRNFTVDGEKFDLHNYIKAYAAENRFTTQIIEEKTINEHFMKCEIMWWLSLALFVKSMRTPWILSDLDTDTAFAGIGYSIKKSPNGNIDIVVGCSHIYNSKGEGLKYKLSKIDNPIIDRKNNPYLNYEEAYKLGVNIVEMFRKSMNSMPNRVVIHKRTPYKDEEIKGLTAALRAAKIHNIDLITITEEDDIRCTDQVCDIDGIKPSNYPVIRGVGVLLSSDTFLLWTHGTVDSIRYNRKYYAGGRCIPIPLRVKKYYGNGDMIEIAKEILGFTKMNWNSFNFYTKLPATIDTSNTLAQVGNLLANKNGVTYDYRYFI